jgi:hypothetical protein
MKKTETRFPVHRPTDDSVFVLDVGSEGTMKSVIETWGFEQVWDANCKGREIEQAVYLQPSLRGKVLVCSRIGIH